MQAPHMPPVACRELWEGELWLAPGEEKRRGRKEEEERKRKEEKGRERKRKEEKGRKEEAKGERRGGGGGIKRWGQRDGDREEGRERRVTMRG